MLVKRSESHSIMSDSLWPHGLYSPRDSPGQNTGVGSLFLLQGIFPTQESNRGLLHCRQILYQLSHKESTKKVLKSLSILIYGSYTGIYISKNGLNCTLKISAFFPILWPPDAKSWLTGKDPDTGKDWGQEEKGMTEDEMVGWYHRLDVHGFGWTLGFGDG